MKRTQKMMPTKTTRPVVLTPNRARMAAYWHVLPEDEPASMPHLVSRESPTKKTPNGIVVLGPRPPRMASRGSINCAQLSNSSGISKGSRHARQRSHSMGGIWPDDHQILRNQQDDYEEEESMVIATTIPGIKNGLGSGGGGGGGSVTNTKSKLPCRHHNKNYHQHPQTQKLPSFVQHSHRQTKHFISATSRNYSVVQFVRENQVAAVPSSWILNGTQAYYPSFVTTKAKENLLKNLAPPKRSWKLYNIKLLKTCDTYEEALKFEEAAEDQSCFETDDEEVQRSSNSFNALAPPINSYNLAAVNSNDAFLVPASQFNYQSIPGPSSSISDQLIQQVPGTTERQLTPTDDTSSNNGLVSGSKDQIVLVTSGDEELKELIKTVITDLNGLKCMVANEFVKIHEELDIVKLAVLGQNHDNEDIPKQNFSDKIPVKDEQDLAALENWLGDDGNKCSMIDYLSTVGGKDADNVTRRILTKLIAKSFAESINWSGANNKIKFSTSPIYSVVKSAVLKHKVAGESTERGIELTVQGWFRFAKARSNPKNGGQQEN